MGDKRAEEPPPLYFGDYPHGSYWSADPKDIDRGAENPGRAQWATTVERSAANPYPIRMFAEIGCDFALWGPVDEPPPTTSGVQEADYLEEELLISVSLRDRLLAWAQDHFRHDGGDHTVSMDDFDERGFFISRELQRELGDLYAVTYCFNFAGPHREALLEHANDQPLPGWRSR
jgi:hypothetical protein